MRSIILFSILLSSQVFAASFDCKKATTPIEKKICGDKELNKLDGELGVAYKKVKRKNKLFHQEHKGWLERRKNCKKLVTKCLIKQYNNRISELNKYIAFGTRKIVAGCFSEEKLQPVLKNGEWEKGEIQHSLNIVKIDANTIKFDLENSNYTGHTCSARGRAYKSFNSYKFKGKDGCVAEISQNERGYMVWVEMPENKKTHKDFDDDSYCDCGARAEFHPDIEYLYISKIKC